MVGQLSSNNNASIDEIVESEEAYSLVGHVDEPLDAQCVQSGDKVKGDPSGHEHCQAYSVDHVPGARTISNVPLTPVKQTGIIMNQSELFLHNKNFTHHIELQ